MKKLKLVLAFAAIVAAATAFAIAPQNDDPCAGQQLYYRTGPGDNDFLPATGGATGCLNFGVDPCKFYWDEIQEEFVPCDLEIYGRVPYIDPQ